MSTTATFLGRFQPLHEGHYRTIRRYRDEYDGFVLALGSPRKARTERNPLTADEREKIIRECFPDIELVHVPDEDRNESGYPTWGRRLIDRTGADVVISGNDLVQRIVREHTDATVQQQEMHAPDRFSGTEIRRRIRVGEPWRSLVPDCCEDAVAEHVDVIRRTGSAD
ncbi:MAG: adenylyltransferase/cytidyltransferase family protein [Halolamina sp.]